MEIKSTKINTDNLEAPLKLKGHKGISDQDSEPKILLIALSTLFS
jgi:hypothetical protein